MKKSAYRAYALFAAALAPVVAITGRASATLLVADGFDYSGNPAAILAGDVNAATGHSWDYTGPTANMSTGISVLSGASLSYPSADSPPPKLPGDNSTDAFNADAKLTNNATTTADRINLPQAYGSGTLYYSMTLKVTTIGTGTGFNAAGGEFIAGFNNTNTGPSTSVLTVGGAVLCMRHDTTNTADYQLGLAQNATTSPNDDRNFNTTDFPTTDTLFIVGTYTFNAAGDTSNLYVFDNTAISQTEPSTPFESSGTGTVGGGTSTALTLGQIASFFLRNTSAEATATTIDDIRVGTTYADVVAGSVVTYRGDSLFWNSTTSGTWDVHDPTVAGSGTGNWYNAGTNLATDTFVQGDAITFADPSTAAGTGTLNSSLQNIITLNTAVTPKSMTFSSNTTNFNISGSGSIGGTGLLSKTGTSILTLSTSNTYTGGTNVSGGTLVLASATAYPVNTALTIKPSAQLTVANHGSGAIYVPQASALTNTGTLDVVNNDFLVHNGVFATVYGQVKAAYNGGAWNGASASGVITSSTAQADTTHLTAVGVATGLTLANFDSSVAAVPTDVLVKYTYYGDANLDGAVDGSDYTLVDAGFNSAGSLTGWQNGDFNYDSAIDGSDYTLIDNAFNTQGASLGVNPLALVASSTAQIASGAVPEPAALGVLGVAAIGLLGRRRRWN